MTKKEKIAAKQKIVAIVLRDELRLSKACAAAEAAGALAIEGELWRATWGAFNDLLDLIDPDGWISWFVYDNDRGKRGYEARASESTQLRPIRTTKDLARLIVESEEA